MTSLMLFVSLILLHANLLNAQTCTVVGQTAVCQNLNGAPPVIQQQLNPNTGVIIQPDGSVTPYTILTPNAPALQPLPGQAPQTTILTPAAPSILVMPTPSVSGY